MPSTQEVLVCMASINRLTSVSAIQDGSTVSVAASPVVAINVMAPINRLICIRLFLWKGGGVNMNVLRLKQ